MRVNPKTNTEWIHVETRLGIVNIYFNLHDNAWRAVETVEIIPANYAGQPQVTLDGHANNRLVQDRINEQA